MSTKPSVRWPRREVYRSKTRLRPSCAWALPDPSRRSHWNRRSRPKTSREAVPAERERADSPRAARKPHGFATSQLTQAGLELLDRITALPSQISDAYLVGDTGPRRANSRPKRRRFGRTDPGLTAVSEENCWSASHKCQSDSAGGKMDKWIPVPRASPRPTPRVGDIAAMLAPA